MQAHMKFVSASGQPVEVSRLHLAYRHEKDHPPETCILSMDSRICSVIRAPDELMWRVAKWVGSGKRRAFTYLDLGVPDRDALISGLLADGFVFLGDDEYVSNILNNKFILQILRQIDLSY